MTRAGLAFLLVALLCLLPLVCEPLPAGWSAPYSSTVLAYGAKALVLLLMGLAIFVQVRTERPRAPHAFVLTALLLVLAGLLTASHRQLVDLQPGVEKWQRELYLDILNHNTDRDQGDYRIPHQFRPLPYGFTRLLEGITGDWWFSCLAYRWFFYYWFLWGCYRFACLFHSRGRALLTLLPVVVLYPFSISLYWGQLTDPLSHSLFVLALIYVVQDRWLALAGALALGVMAKETVALLVASYLVWTWYRGLLVLFRKAAQGTPQHALEGELERLSLWSLVKSSGLGMVCIAAFLATRLPLGWRPGARALNGNEEAMLKSNLLLPEWARALGMEPPGYIGAAPAWQTYYHLVLFVGIFLPAIAYFWRRIDGSLKCLFWTLVPLMIVSNLYFSWGYESRNYMPLVPLLATMALPVSRSGPRVSLSSHEAPRGPLTEAAPGQPGGALPQIAVEGHRAAGV